jgi:hypothetical protein
MTPLKLRRIVPSPAMIVALLALFVATSSGAYAVATLGAHTVGTKQLKRGAVTTAKLRGDAVTSAKVANGSLTAADFQAGQIQAGTGTLAPGRTETGVFSVGGPAYTANATFLSPVTFPIPLAAELPYDHTIYVTGSSATHCPGRGHADRGYLCLYELYNYTGFTTSPKIVKPTSTVLIDGGAAREGFMLDATADGTYQFVAAWGSWAVTG